MSYPPRPPLEPYDSGSVSPSTYTPNPGETFPLRPVQVQYTDVERGHIHHPSDATSLGPNKLQKPGWDRKDSGQGSAAGYESDLDKNASRSQLIEGNGNGNGGDPTNNKIGRAYRWFLTFSVVTRWVMFVVPILGILWIPGILSLTRFPNARVWSVKLIWWSIWLTVVWAGWWAALALSHVIPVIIRSTIGVVAVSTRRYIDWLQALHRYIAIFAWTLGVWISWNPLIDNHQVNPGGKSQSAIDLIGKMLFGVFICAAILLGEKFAIQFIAGKFHERSYADRIADQKAAVTALVTLYKRTVDIPGRSDTLLGGSPKSLANPRHIFRKLASGARLVTTTTATVFGNVASEIMGSSVLQPNSPQAIIKTALESANKSRLLARRIFYSFVKGDSEYLLVKDIRKCFPDDESAAKAFALFDKDGNGDASREEIEMACLEFHREQLSIENSMRDLDSAVGRLDNIFMSVYVVIAALVMAVTMEAQIVTLVTGAGTLILGLSWLIGGSLQEVLTSIIFLFIKHPFDVGDRVILNKETYTVKEIRLLSTIFLNGDSTLVQAPNKELNNLFIQNIRRSPQMSETFTFDVNYSTSFEDLEKLREKMLAFVTAERRDYQPVFDVTVKDFPEQSKMTLSADIKYKSNFQQGALKAKRRNKWICALKTTLGELHIYGPAGNPNPPPSVARYTQVPWQDILAQEHKDSGIKMPSEEVIPAAGWKLSDKNAAILGGTDDVFGESDELHMTSPRRGLSQANTPTLASPGGQGRQPGMPIPTDFAHQPR